MTHRHRPVSRRHFLGTMGSAAAGMAAVLPAGKAFAATARASASNRITMASIGTGGMGTTDLYQFLHRPNTQVVAVCDVDKSHRDKARDIVNHHYASVDKRPSYNGCDAYTDFRELLVRNDIDAVGVGTPDHWHAIQSIQALESGKDVFCQKPMTLTIAEGQAMVDAVRRTGRVFQLGTQNRSHPVVRRIVSLIHSGAIGEVKHVDVGVCMGAAIPLQPVMPIPEGLDYDLWLGPAPWEPYTQARCHVSFRGILDYSGGSVTDLGTHYLDVTHWACGLDRTGPVRIEGEGQFYENMLSDVAGQFHFALEYANGITVDVSTDHPWGCRFQGTNGWIYLPLGFPGPETNPVTKEPEASDPDILKTRLGPEAPHFWGTHNHYENFVTAVETRREALIPVDIGHRSTSACHLGNIAMRLGRKLRWDPDNEVFIDDVGANAMVSRAMRGAWRLG